MATGRHSRFHRTSGPPKAKLWDAGPRQVIVPSITAGGATLWAVGVQATVDLTLLRIRGSLACWLESVGTIGDGFARVGHGICIVNENAFGVGVTAVPHPLTDMNWDGWIFYNIMSPVIGFSVTESENTGPLSQVRIEVDSKAMRKHKPLDVLVGVTEVAGEIGAATLQVIAETRIFDLIC